MRFVSDRTLVFDTPQGVSFYFMAARLGALRIQRDTGLTHSRGSVLKVCKRDYGIKANRIAAACDEMAALVEGAQQAHGRASSVSCKYTERVEIEAFIRGAAMEGLELAMPPAQILRRIPWDNEEKTTKTITWRIE
jgi:hypothetical protein